MSTTTISYQGFELEVIRETTAEEIRSAIEFASMYEYDREDITDGEINAHIQETVYGLIRAHAEAFPPVSGRGYTLNILAMLVIMSLVFSLIAR